jgi:DHA1 family bicyclomycin/chloramphenicol resistance-like MFS transporter
VTSRATSTAEPTRTSVGWPLLICNGGVMGNAAALAMPQVREVAGTGSAVLGCSQFTIGAVVSPLVGLGGEHSALVPAVVMATASALGFIASRVGLLQPRSSSSAIATS